MKTHIKLIALVTILLGSVSLVQASEDLLPATSIMAGKNEIALTSPVIQESYVIQNQVRSRLAFDANSNLDDRLQIRHRIDIPVKFAQQQLVEFCISTLDDTLSALPALISNR